MSQKAQKRMRRLARAAALCDEQHLDGDRANVIGNKVIGFVAAHLGDESPENLIGGLLAATAYVVRESGAVEEDAINAFRTMLRARMWVVPPGKGGQAQA